MHGGGISYSHPKAQRQQNECKYKTSMIQSATQHGLTNDSLCRKVAEVAGAMTQLG